MASSPGSTKQISLSSLVLALVLSVLVFIWMAGQIMTLGRTQRPADLSEGQRLLIQGKLDAAKKQFETYLGHEGKGAVGYMDVMQVCDSEKNWGLGREYGDRALDLYKFDSGEVRAQLNLQMSLTYSIEDESHPQRRALYFAKRALELDKDNPDVLNNYGYLLADNATNQAEVDEALGYIERALKILRGQVGSGVLGFFGFGAVGNSGPFALASAEDSYGWALYHRGKYVSSEYVRAADALEQAVSDLPEKVPDDQQKTMGEIQKVFYYHLGVAEHAAGRLHAAQNALNVALCYDPKYADALRELGTLSEASMLPTTGGTDQHGAPVGTTDGTAPGKPTSGLNSGASIPGSSTSHPSTSHPSNSSNPTVPPSPPLKDSAGHNVFTPLSSGHGSTQNGKK